MNTKGDLNEVNLHSVWPRYYLTRHFEDTFTKFLLGNKARYILQKSIKTHRNSLLESIDIDVSSTR